MVEKLSSNLRAGHTSPEAPDSSEAPWNCAESEPLTGSEGFVALELALKAVRTQPAAGKTDAAATCAAGGVPGQWRYPAANSRRLPVLDAPILWPAVGSTKLWRVSPRVANRSLCATKRPSRHLSAGQLIQSSNYQRDAVY